MPADPSKVAAWKLLFSLAKHAGSAAAVAVRGITAQASSDCPDANGNRGPTPCQQKALDAMIGQQEGAQP